MSNIFTAVISNYLPRGESRLRALISQLLDKVDKIIVVVNDDNCHHVRKEVISDKIILIVRPNTGMNIGAWSEAIGHCEGSDYTIFLQDECTLVEPNFIEKYQSLLSNPNVGMIGESINPKWDCEWTTVAKSNLNYLINLSNGQTISRVDYYLHCMKNWGIHPGNKSTHLRALVWAFNKIGLKSIVNFPLGSNKEECIAAEIAVSRKIIQQNLEFKQSDLQSFKYFEHEEWSKDGIGKK